ncbi:MAG: hypothetical protein HQ522_13945, partial [Bacteroidetes bacterium]|nr:hypothetical protein [Bacteroidota bacterium]
MKRLTFKISALIIFMNSHLLVAQEWNNLKAYQKETNNSTLLDGCWLKKDRKKQTEVWKLANTYNLFQNNGNLKYKTIREIRDFYVLFDD